MRQAAYLIFALKNPCQKNHLLRMLATLNAHSYDF